MAFEKVFECHDEGELSLIKSLLDANGIEYFVKNEHFGSLYPGHTMPFNGRSIMVQHGEVDRTQVLLSRLYEAETFDEAG